MRSVLSMWLVLVACGQPPLPASEVPSSSSAVRCELVEGRDCCADQDCTAKPNGACVDTPIFYCGGVAPLEGAECMYDACASDADCASNEVCLARGAFGEPVSRCAATFCRTDSECSNGTDGQCTAFVDPCSGRFRGSVCTYNESECRTAADCTAEQGRAECIAYGDSTRCIDYSPPP